MDKRTFGLLEVLRAHKQGHIKLSRTTKQIIHMGLRRRLTARRIRQEVDKSPLEVLADLVMALEETRPPRGA